VLAVRRGDELAWAGNCGTGFGEKEIERLLRKLRPLERKTSPFPLEPKMARVKKDEIVWVTPKLVAEIEFAEWTHDGHLRAPSYVGLREDQVPEEVRREQPVSSEVRRGRRTLKLSNLDKVFWDRVLPRGGAAARPAPEGPAVHDEAVPRRDRGWALLSEGRAVPHAGLDPEALVPLDLARDA
jgi:hypothetical protein